MSNNEWCGVSGRPVRCHVELCILWDAPEAVVDINSAEVVTLGSFADKVGLFGRRKDAAVSRILQGRDSRSVRFLVPDAPVADPGGGGGGQGGPDPPTSEWKI